MSVEIIHQLRALRDSIAEALQKDPRYLTISALDRSIAEIANVLASANAVGTTTATRYPPAPPRAVAPDHARL